MKAELISGEIVELEQDCSCMTHDGPHWLHANDIDRLIYARMLEPQKSQPFRTLPRVQQELILQRYCEKEKARLAERLAHMERRGIRRIVREGS